MALGVADYGASVDAHSIENAAPVSRQAGRGGVSLTSRSAMSADTRLAPDHARTGQCLRRRRRKNSMVGVVLPCCCCCFTTRQKGHR
ncbi:hypothetical protein EAG_10218 [Camponotus floridanus]|uniref:Uncharacterized protein n=1 Tax=Camponotus floridanus TaxID=104421 RepID=E1ZZK3_CAMFO|nr:hypothetical protein EAG_10218 [Camponotus floridanus]